MLPSKHHAYTYANHAISFGSSCYSLSLQPYPVKGPKDVTFPQVSRSDAGPMLTASALIMGAMLSADCSQSCSFIHACILCSVPISARARNAFRLLRRFHPYFVNPILPSWQTLAPARSRSLSLNAEPCDPIIRVYHPLEPDSFACAEAGSSMDWRSSSSHHNITIMKIFLLLLPYTIPIHTARS